VKKAPKLLRRISDAYITQEINMSKKEVSSNIISFLPYTVILIPVLKI
jgi:hypothetical protein